MIARGIASWANNGASYLKDYHWQMQSAKLLLLDGR